MDGQDDHAALALGVDHAGAHVHRPGGEFAFDPGVRAHEAHVGDVQQAQQLLRQGQAQLHGGVAGLRVHTAHIGHAHHQVQIPHGLGKEHRRHVLQGYVLSRAPAEKLHRFQGGSFDIRRAEPVCQGEHAHHQIFLVKDLLQPFLIVHGPATALQQCQSAARLHLVARVAAGHRALLPFVPGKGVILPEDLLEGLHDPLVIEKVHPVRPDPGAFQVVGVGRTKPFAAGRGEAADILQQETLLAGDWKADAPLAAPEQLFHHGGEHRVLQQVLKLRGEKLGLLRHGPLQTLPGPALLLLQLLCALLETQIAFVFGQGLGESLEQLPVLSHGHRGLALFVDPQGDAVALRLDGLHQGPQLLGFRRLHLPGHAVHIVIAGGDGKVLQGDGAGLFLALPPLGAELFALLQKLLDERPTA